MDLWNVLVDSAWFWIFVGLTVFAVLFVAVPSIVGARREKAERRAYSAAAYRQLHDRQEFRRIVEANRDDDDA